MRVSRGLAAALIVGLVLAAYLAGTAPDVLFGDGAELQAAGSTGGIAHPSGYPAFLLTARLFAHLPLGNAAHRLNVMSAVFGAAASGTLLLVLFELGLSTAAAAVGALAYGASFTLVWAAERCEVYTLAIALFLIALWRSLVAIRTRSPRDAGAAAFLLGLAMTGHLVFGPPVLLLSALVALPLPLAAPRRVGAWLGLAALFALGLSPYATLAVADRLNTATNYLRLVVEPAGGQFGLTPETFAAPWTRIAWLVFGPEAHPVALAWHPRVALANLGAAAVRLFAFEFGPAGLVLAVLGARRLAGAGARAAALAGVAGLALAASALAIERRMLAIFLIPCGIVVAALIAAGIDAALARLAPRAGAARLAGAALALALVVPLPHLLRARAPAAGALGWTPIEEWEPRREGLVPSLRGAIEARAFGEAALAAIPRGAFVAGKWREIMVLVYLQAVEGRRPDLALDPWYPAHAVRLERWQRAHDPREHPIVLLGSVATLRPWLARADSVALAGGGYLIVQRAPVTLPAPPSAAGAGPPRR